MTIERCRHCERRIYQRPDGVWVPRGKSLTTICGDNYTRGDGTDGPHEPGMTDDELRDAIDGLHAYDGGALDSGIHDEDLRARVKAYLDTCDLDEVARLIAPLYTDEQGYGPEDRGDLREWLRDEMGVAL